jgi:hypothetical protein
MMLMENIRQALPIKVAAADADHVLDLRQGVQAIRDRSRG